MSRDAAGGAGEGLLSKCPRYLSHRPAVLHLEEGIEERQHREGEVLSLLADEGTPSLEGAAIQSPVAVVGVIGRGRGFGYHPGGRGSGNEYEEQRDRLLEPIAFVRAKLTARTLFEEEEDIFKPEVVDMEQGDSIPAADFVEAAFASQQDAEEGDEGSNPDENDLDDTASTNADLTGSNAPLASSSKQVPRLDISSAVSLATALKDAALTPREEHFALVSSALPKAITEEKTSPTPLASDSDSESEDVVLFVPQPRTPLRSMTPLPLLAAPKPMLGVSPSPIRPSPLATSFRPPLQEEETLEVIPEATGPKPEATTTETTNDTDTKAAEGAKPMDKVEPTTTSDADIPSINFEDLSSIMFVDTNPTPVALPPKAENPKPVEKHILGTSPTKPSLPPSAPNFHDMRFKFAPHSTTPQTAKQTAPSERVVQDTPTVAKPTEIATPSAPAKPPTPNFHTMTFTFTPRSVASRARKPPPGGNPGGPGSKSKSTPRVPREGDSDLDWGDEGPPKPKGKASEAKEDESDGDHGMVEDIDSATMLKFLKGVEAREWVTMDDVKDEEKLRQEDEDEGESGSESDESGEDEDSDEYVSEDEEELNRIIAAAEAEFADSAEESDDDMDESFGTRLAHIRQSTGRNGEGKGEKRNGKGKERMDDDSEDDEIQMGGFSWAEKDEAYIAAIEEQLEEELFLKRERKRGITNPPMSPASRGKNKHVPVGLQAQWERDRAKKAENKRLRALQRQIAAQEAPKRGSGRKSKAALMFNNSGAASSLPALESKLRAFVANLGVRTMALPAMDKESRRRVHLLAECFRIKTASKGSGTGRYVSLIRTSRTGLAIDEAKIRRLIRAVEDAEDGGAAAFNRAYYRNDGEGGSGGKARIKTRDGEVVGRTAAKIGVDNIGHQLLSKMGWSEGDRIGKSGGIADPLVAVMKNTKLGLGATRK
ncbi:hypothetical protein FRC10_002201 [Ceratobasidium sp. 414]|nr:hypothetical protein FRC10_002201 [Ceratobasidium sp. 414]